MKIPVRDKKTGLFFGEDLSYWGSTRASVDEIRDRTARVIAQYGGRVTRAAYGMHNGREGYMLEFTLAEDLFRIQWPVLPTRDPKRNEKQTKARKQAVTMIHHDVKARLVSAAVIGARQAFFSYLVLGDGSTCGELVNLEVADLRGLLPAPRSAESGNK